MSLRLKIKSDVSGSPICTALKIKDLGLGWVIYHKVFCAASNNVYLSTNHYPLH